MCGNSASRASHPSAAPPPRRQIHARFGVEHNRVVDQNASPLGTREACDRLQHRRLPRARRTVHRRDPVRQRQIDLEAPGPDARVRHKAATMVHSIHTRTNAIAAAARIGRQPSGSITRQKIRHSEQPRLRAALPYSRSKSCKRLPRRRTQPAAVPQSLPTAAPACHGNAGRRSTHARITTGVANSSASSPSVALRPGELPRRHPVSQPESHRQRACRRDAGDSEG